VSDKLVKVSSMGWEMTGPAGCGSIVKAREGMWEVYVAPYAWVKEYCIGWWPTMREAAEELRRQVGAIG